jgi:hypothetical protein
MYGLCSESANSPQPIEFISILPFCSENIPKTNSLFYPLRQRILINGARLCESRLNQPADVQTENQMPRKKPSFSPRHPTEAMARFDRLLRAMAPKASVPDNAEPRPVPPRGRKRIPKKSPPENP